MDPQLETRFDEAMMALYTKARGEANYNATAYHQMLMAHRGVETARRLVLASSPSEGYTKLFLKKCLYLTVEALVIDDEWIAVFAEEPHIIARARKRLDDYDYVVRDRDSNGGHV